MKKLNSFLLLCMSVALVAGCTKSKTPEDNSTLTVSPSRTSVAFAADPTGQSYYFTVETNQPTWSVVSSHTWCEVEENAEKTGFTVTAQKNTGTTASPDATITVTAGTRTVTMTATQGAPGVLINQIEIDGNVYPIKTAWQEYYGLLSGVGNNVDLRLMETDDPDDSDYGSSFYLITASGKTIEAGTYAYAPRGSANYGKVGTFYGGQAFGDAGSGYFTAGTVTVTLDGTAYTIAAEGVVEDWDDNEYDVKASYTGELALTDLGPTDGTSTIKVGNFTFNSNIRVSVSKYGGIYNDALYGTRVEIEGIRDDLGSSLEGEFYLYHKEQTLVPGTYTPIYLSNYNTSATMPDTPAGDKTVGGMFGVSDSNYEGLWGYLSGGTVSITMSGDSYTLDFDSAEFISDEGATPVSGKYTGAVLSYDRSDSTPPFHKYTGSSNFDAEGMDIDVDKTGVSMYYYGVNSLGQHSTYMSIPLGGSKSMKVYLFGDGSGISPGTYTFPSLGNGDMSGYGAVYMSEYTPSNDIIGGTIAISEPADGKYTITLTDVASVVSRAPVSISGTYSGYINYYDRVGQMDPYEPKAYGTSTIKGGDSGQYSFPCMSAVEEVRSESDGITESKVRLDGYSQGYEYKMSIYLTTYFSEGDITGTYAFSEYFDEDVENGEFKISSYVENLKDAIGSGIGIDGGTLAVSKDANGIYTFELTVETSDYNPWDISGKYTGRVDWAKTTRAAVAAEPEIPSEYEAAATTPWSYSVKNAKPGLRR